MTKKILAATYYHTLTEVFWPLSLENLNNDYMSQIEKNGRNCQKVLKFVMLKSCKTFQYIYKL